MSVRTLVESCRISDVYRALAGSEPRRSGRDTWRAPATWRGGNGYNVALDDGRGVWHDFTTDAGGGVLDLVAIARGGTRRDALKWLADFTGTPLDDAPHSPEDRARFAEERKRAEQDLPDARFFHRGVMRLCEETLDCVKARYFDPAESAPDYADAVAMRDITSFLESLTKMGDAGVLDLYRSWRNDYPGMTAGIIRAVRARDAVQRRALVAYLRQTNPRRPAL